MKNKKFVITVLIALLAIGIISVFAIGREDSSWFSYSWKSSGKHFNKNFGDKSFLLERLGFPSNATETQIQEALKVQWGQRKEEYNKVIKEKPGLPQNATQEQVIEALKQKGENDKMARLQRVKAKLGLPEDASEEEVQEALQKWREENKDLLMGFDHIKQGFHKGFLHNKN